MLKEIKERDWQDSHREIAPLKKADDAVLVDTTGYGLEDAVKAVMDVIAEKLK